MKNSTYKFVCLEGLKHKNRFYTSNHTEPEKIHNGEIAYKVLGFANTPEEAQEILYPNETIQDKQLRMKNYMMKMPHIDEIVSQEDIERISKLF